MFTQAYHIKVYLDRDLQERLRPVEQGVTISSVN